MQWFVRVGTVMLLLAGFGMVARAQETTRKGHRILIADDSTHRIAIIGADGKTEWEHKIGPTHDLHLLPSGNVLMQLSWTVIAEIDPKTDKIVWQYDAGKNNGNQGKRLEIHSFQRLADGTTLIAESGPGRLIEVDFAGKLVREMKLKIAHPDAHTDTRLVRKLPSGNYLVCQEGDGVVREYAPRGKVAWEYAVPMFGKSPRGGHGPEGFGNKCFAALRLANGNTLLSTGNGHSILEVTPTREIVWSLQQGELPGIELAWVTTLQVMPNGNIVFGNCHAGAANPQVIEIDRDKKVIWTFQDFKRFGNSTPNSQIIDSGNGSIR